MRWGACGGHVGGGSGGRVGGRLTGGVGVVGFTHYENKFGLA